MHACDNFLQWQILTHSLSLSLPLQLRCFAVHRPNNFAASLSVSHNYNSSWYVCKVNCYFLQCQALLGTEGVAEAFRSQTVSISNAQHMSRTFYMIAASNEEREAWITAINDNSKAYAVRFDI